MLIEITRITLRAREMFRLIFLVLVENLEQVATIRNSLRLSEEFVGSLTRDENSENSVLTFRTL